MEKDIDHFVILAVDIVVIDEFQELPHLVLCDGFPCHAVIDHHPGKLKAERILHQHVNRHLESRAQDAPHGLDGAVMPPVLPLYMRTPNNHKNKVSQTETLFHSCIKYSIKQASKYLYTM